MKSVKNYLLLFMISAGIASHAQDLNVDSLKLVVLTMAEDTNKVNTLNTIADLVYRTSPDEAVEYGSQAKPLAEQLGFQKGLALAYKNIGLGEYMQGNIPEAIKNWEPALELFRKLGDVKMEANILSNLGSSYYQTGKSVEALEYALPALKMAEDMGDSLRIGTLLMTIGLVYSEQTSTLDSALNYYLRVIELADSKGFNNLLGVATINLGEVYLEKEDLDQALYYFEKSLTIVTSPIDMAASLTFIGRIYSERGDDQKAIIYYNDALEMAREENAQGQVVGILLGLATTYENQKLHERAIDYYKRSESIAEENGLNQELSSTYEGLATNYAELYDFPNAYKYLSLHNTIDNTIYRIESENQAKDLINSYQMEKKQNEIEILEQKSKIEQLLSKRQRGMLIGTALFGLLILALAGGLYNRMKFIRETNEKINAQNELITDSISYAQRIQSAILPSQEMLKLVMPEHFVILKPKDIVSGDFYWVKEVQDHLVIVGADCTGHGVPGAFMSMLGITLLNDLIDDHCYDAPSAILEKLRTKVKEMLVQDGGVDEQKDGMD
ncbi:MAG: tetratricopeptide repeat protein, partial [Bacteroidia bacterium]